MPDSTFSEAILKWFDRHGRKDLPWQQDINPYRVWVSEIMLQQTQVGTVIPYYEKFMASFPTVNSLATADEDKVLQHWSGLGYYARARNLHKTAQLVHREYQGEFPESVEQLTQLPGIGRSTAGAIFCISMAGRAPILDGNVKRVLARYHAVEGWTGQTKTQKLLWQYAERYTPTARIADYTQAIMDLGATLCTRSNPQCQRCPLKSTCEAYATDRVSEFPNAKPKKSIPTRHAYFILLKNNEGEILLEKRPPQGIWGGLWSLPQHEDKTEIIQQLEQTLGCGIEETLAAKSRRHTFSHFHLEMQPIHALINSRVQQVTEPNRWRWYNTEEIDQVGLAAPIKSILKTA